MNVDLAATRLVEFKRELEDKIKHHQNLRRLDASFHRLLIIGAVVSGCLSLVAGLLYKEPAIAGILGVIPSGCTVLIQNLQCVKAQNWHEQMSVAVDGIRKKLLYETPAVTLDDIAILSRELRVLEGKMADDWAKTTNAQSLDLTIKKAH
jgi:hypothetical protein